jgi:hypothetical protein
MNILDINNLPTLTLKVTGRKGVPLEAWVINQEEKSKSIIPDTDIVYTQGDTLVITLTDTDFISSIVEDTTLSVILIGNQTRDTYNEGIYEEIILRTDAPLYRDIVTFTGELNKEETYSQYEESSEYFIYSTPIFNVLAEDGSFLITENNENIITQ